jgi:hypothetical protein
MRLETEEPAVAQGRRAPSETKAQGQEATARVIAESMARVMAVAAGFVKVVVVVVVAPPLAATASQRTPLQVSNNECRSVLSGSSSSRSAGRSPPQVPTPRTARRTQD